jgi:hypothetical protein
LANVAFPVKAALDSLAASVGPDNRHPATARTAPQQAGKNRLERGAFGPACEASTFRVHRGEQIVRYNAKVRGIDRPQLASYGAGSPSRNLGRYPLFKWCRSEGSADSYLHVAADFEDARQRLGV